MIERIFIGERESDSFRLFQQECMARAASVGEDLMFLNDLDSDLFQRMGILAAFDSWERAKRLIYISFEKQQIINSFLV